MVTDLMFLIVALQHLQGLQHFPGFSHTRDLFQVRTRESAVTPVTPVHAGMSGESSGQASRVER